MRIDDGYNPCHGMPEARIKLTLFDRIMVVVVMLMLLGGVVILLMCAFTKGGK